MSKSRKLGLAAAALRYKRRGPVLYGITRPLLQRSTAAPSTLAAAQSPAAMRRASSQRATVVRDVSVASIDERQRLAGRVVQAVAVFEVAGIGTINSGNRDAARFILR